MWFTDSVFVKLTNFVVQRCANLFYSLLLGSFVWNWSKSGCHFDVFFDWWSRRNVNIHLTFRKSKVWNWGKRFLYFWWLIFIRRLKGTLSYLYSFFRLQGVCFFKTLKNVGVWTGMFCMFHWAAGLPYFTLFCWTDLISIFYILFFTYIFTR